MSTPYHPQGNGVVEHLNRLLAESLSKLVADNQWNWLDHLPTVQFAHNTTFHEHIAAIRYKVVLKEDPRTIIHATADNICSEVNHITSLAYVSDKESAVPELYEAVEANSQRAAAARKI